MRWLPLLGYALAWAVGAYGVVLFSPRPSQLSGNGFYPPALLALLTAITGAAGVFWYLRNAAARLLSARARQLGPVIAVTTLACAAGLLWATGALRDEYFQAADPTYIHLQHVLPYYLRSWTLAAALLLVAVAVGAAQASFTWPSGKRGA